LLLQDEGDLTGARPLIERALALREKALGPTHSHPNRSRCHLSRVLLLIGIPTEALPLGEAALAAHDKILGRHHPWTQRPRHRRCARRAWPHRGGEGGAGEVWGRSRRGEALRVSAN